MEKKKKICSWNLWIICLTAVLCFAVVLGSVAFGDNVTDNDPLISLSYLNGIFKTDLMSEIGKTIENEVEDLNDDLLERMNDLRDAMGSVPSPASTHSTVTVSSGFTHSVSSGTEILVLSGSIAVNEAGLLDTTTGLAVMQKETLQENHLYIACSRVTLKAESTTKLLIRK